MRTGAFWRTTTDPHQKPTAYKLSHNENIVKAIQVSLQSDEIEKKWLDLAKSKNISTYSMETQIGERDFTKPGIAELQILNPHIRNTNGHRVTFAHANQFTFFYTKPSPCIELLKTAYSVRLIGSIQIEKKRNPTRYQFEMHDESILHCEIKR